MWLVDFDRCRSIAPVDRLCTRTPISPFPYLKAHALINPWWHPISGESRDMDEILLVILLASDEPEPLVAVPAH